MNEIVIVVSGILQASSAFVLLKVAVSIGKILQQVNEHERRIERIENRLDK